MIFLIVMWSCCLNTFILDFVYLHGLILLDTKCIIQSYFPPPSPSLSPTTLLTKHCFCPDLILNMIYFTCLQSSSKCLNNTQIPSPPPPPQKERFHVHVLLEFVIKLAILCVPDFVRVVNLRGKLKSSRKQSSELHFDFKVESLGKFKFLKFDFKFFNVCHIMFYKRYGSHIEDCFF